MARYFTSESVTMGHPDKVADQISDGILDAILDEDPGSRVACETLVKDNIVTIAGEISSRASVHYDQIIRDTVRKIGYTNPEHKFNANNLFIAQQIGRQSPDIAQGVDRGAKLSQGAGDQGMMFGYATNSTTNKMPLPISLAQQLSRRLEELRQRNILPYLEPDGKTQVSVEYTDDFRQPIRLHNVVVSTQHAPGIDQEKITADMRKMIADVCGDWFDDQTEVHVNPTGRFETGGPDGDSGLTGRKIIVDTYGGWESHGGGAFSGKDPSKVDRSGAYAARWVAKNVVAAGLADECGIQLSYAIGVARPLSITAQTRGTAKVSEALIEEGIRRAFDLRPGAIVDDLRLLDVKYQPFASGGHMGREDLNAPWEEMNKVDDLLRAIKG